MLARPAVRSVLTRRFTRRVPPPPGWLARCRASKGDAAALCAASASSWRHQRGHRKRGRKEIQVDETQMMEFVGRAVADVGALLGGAMVVLGDKLGLYRAMAGTGSFTSAELAARTGTAERYVREWLSAQAARGYVTYDGDGRFSLPDEHAVPLTDEASPACVIGAFEIALGSVYATDKIAERFRSGDGFAWGAHDQHVLRGCERFFRPGYLNNLGQRVDPGPGRGRDQAGRRGAGRRRRLWPRGVDAAAGRCLSRLGDHRLRRARRLHRGRPQARRRRRAGRARALRGRVGHILQRHL